MSNEDNTSCCQGACNSCDPSATPLEIYNAPNRPSLDYKVGTHGSFKATMLRQLTQGEALRSLTVNSDKDHTAALLDASSVTLDILSFYQQRLANEHYLGTATERYSIHQIAQSIGYELSPGVAATGYLAFSLLDAPGSPTSVTVPEGAQVQSQPKEDEAPQIFETSEAIEARTAWNAMRPILARWKAPQESTRIFYLNGLSTNLTPGDPVLLVSHHAETDDTRTLFRRIEEVDTDFEKSLTKIKLGSGLSKNFVADAEERSYELFALRQQAAIFGYNETMYDEREDANDNTYLVPRPKDSSERKELSNPVLLDNAYKNISPGSWVVFKKSVGKIAVQIDEVKEAIAENSMTSVRVSELHVSVDDFTGYNDGNTTVYMQSEAMEIMPEPLDAPISGSSFIIDTREYDFRENHPIALTGTESNTGETVSEIALIESIHVGDTTMPDASSRTIITVTLKDDGLEHNYERDSLSISGNVVHATHGQSRFEILGSGDGSQSMQEFLLKNAPLTYIPAANDTGAASTLTVKVDDITWEEAETHYAAETEDSSYTIEITDEHTAKIKFGDGQQGRRLPTGSNNVVANYRQGLGQAGLLDPGQLNILLTRPLGLQSATNPAATFGGEDPESTENARVNAPLKVLTIDRVVSLNDFRYFARAFTGIAKATSQWIWNGQQRIIHLTVAATDGATPADNQLDLLTEAIDKRRDPFQLFVIDGYTPIYFKLTGTLWIDERYDQTLVQEAAIAAVQASYAFEERDFGQSITAAEIYALLQGIDGVIGVDLDTLEYEDPGDRTLNETDPAQVRLEARGARFSNQDYLPAEILLINADDSAAITLNTQTA